MRQWESIVTVGQRRQGAATPQLGPDKHSVAGVVATTLNPLSLPTSSDRAEAFARARGSAPFYDQRLSAWIVLDPPSVTRVLQDDRLVVPDVNAALRALEERYNIGLPHLRWAASVLPLLANGEHHRRVRQPLAKYVSSEKIGTARLARDRRRLDRRDTGRAASLRCLSRIAVADRQRDL